MFLSQIHIHRDAIGLNFYRGNITVSMRNGINKTETQHGVLPYSDYSKGVFFEDKIHIIYIRVYLVIGIFEEISPSHT